MISCEFLFILFVNVLILKYTIFAVEKKEFPGSTYGLVVYAWREHLSLSKLNTTKSYNTNIYNIDTSVKWKPCIGHLSAHINEGWSHTKRERAK